MTTTPMASSMYPFRFTQRATPPTVDPELFKKGQDHLKTALRRYHWLCAAIQQKYTILDNIPVEFGPGVFFPRQGLDFTPYTQYSFEPVRGVKLHPREDGTIHPGDLELYRDWFEGNWRCREAGILYCVAEFREFWNMVINYHSVAKTTGKEDWDKLFEKLKRRACIRDREDVLKKRRTTLAAPTTRDISLREQRFLDARAESSRNDTSSGVPNTDDEDDEIFNLNLDLKVDPEMEAMRKESARILKICSNPECLAVVMKNETGEATPESPKLVACSRCKFTYYCDVSLMITLLTLLPLNL
ncbi:hypothetical protein NLI96_g9439 [Meripilus lineatus]|uniref:Uncharacterized protein n=1 Tax=Meripilus lineatus TaxID=2056292 RepID=A0AAD5UVG0_9APHY|nr:hypothetical protein NLI96_g9439 [Physisporinus lineatus]